MRKTTRVHLGIELHKLNAIKLAAIVTACAAAMNLSTAELVDDLGYLVDSSDPVAMASAALDVANAAASTITYQISPETIEWGGFLSGNFATDHNAGKRAERAILASVLA
jgi:hypothetical protein